MLKLVKTAEDWQRELDAVTCYDVYHTYAYHELEGRRQNAEPVLMSYCRGERRVLLPLLLRAIGKGAGRDATSVYGYGGLLASQELPGSPAEILGQFRQALLDAGVVSVFTRFHPIIDHSELAVLGEVREVGRTVSIDLRLPEEEQLAQYERGHRYDIRKLERDGFTCRFSKADRDIELFHSIYADTMRRVGARETYFFDLEYLRSVIQSPGMDVRLVLCELAGEVAAAATFSFQPPFVQGHLAGTRTEYLRRSPMKLIYDVVRRSALAEGYGCLHLGGGVNGQQDSLFNYKRGFSSLIHDFRIWRWVVDEQAYAALCHRAGQPLPLAQQGFFPAYRSLLEV